MACNISLGFFFLFGWLVVFLFVFPFLSTLLHPCEDFTDHFSYFFATHKTSEHTEGGMGNRSKEIL